MSTHLSEELLSEHALDILAPDDRAAVAAHLATCAACAQSLLAVRESLVALTAALPPVAPPAGLRATLLAATEPAFRYDGFARRVAHLFDIEESKALEYLRAAADPQTRWEDMPGMGGAVALLHFDGGPRTSGADVGVVRFAPGLHFPKHTHHGRELQLYLQGRVVDDTGREWLPGDFSLADSTTQHSFDVDQDEPCVTALVLFDGLHMLER